MFEGENSSCMNNVITPLMYVVHWEIFVSLPFDFFKYYLHTDLYSYQEFCLHPSIYFLVGSKVLLKITPLKYAEESVEFYWTDGKGRFFCILFIFFYGHLVLASTSDTITFIIPLSHFFLFYLFITEWMREGSSYSIVGIKKLMKKRYRKDSC